MKKAVRIGKKTLPAWLLVMALTMAGAGAAVGTVLAPKITGEIPVTVSQALLINSGQSISFLSTWDSVSYSTPDASIATVKDDETAFTVGMELNNGDQVAIKLHLKNESDQDIIGKLTLSGIPKGITVDVDSGTDDITNVTRVGKYTWLFKATKDAGDDSNDFLVIKIALADNMKPGFYQIHGKIEPVNY